MYFTNREIFNLTNSVDCSRKYARHKKDSFYFNFKLTFFLLFTLYILLPQIPPYLVISSAYFFFFPLTALFHLYTLVAVMSEPFLRHLT
jgi:hypothetical protein